MNIKQVKILQKELRKILNEWDFIGGSPNDEYDCLGDKIISYLGQREDIGGLSDLIKEDLRSHFGLETYSGAEIEKQAKIILEWWRNIKP